MKYITLVLTYDKPLYNVLDDIRRIYLHENNENNLFVYNGEDTTKNDLTNNITNYYSDVKNIAGIPAMFYKFIDIIERNMLTEYDFVIRTNSSTFLNMPVLKKILSTLNPQDDVWAGFYAPDWHFISGSCIIFSQSTLKKLIAGKNKFNVNIEDDVLIGQILTSQGVPKTYIDRYQFCERTTLPTDEEIQHSLQFPTIRVRNETKEELAAAGSNDPNWKSPTREIIDVGIWNKIYEQISKQ